jgi:heterodisulfide reductase subunit B
MHCVACDKVLSTFEASRKSKKTGEYLDMCNRCYSSIEDTVETTTNNSLPYQPVNDYDDSIGDNDDDSFEHAEI